ncbi:MAG: lipid-A-disaccharide synthase N-terminal domain-containing protein, partial [Rubrivivax sp.]|nr:lipid-A-disaccharide synthase N-terminal domain-containing protein [Rubrivivax sp.]
EHSAVSAGSTVKFDLLGEIAEKTQLTRRTCAAILTGVNPGTFAKFKQNPEQFITEAARLVNEQKATVIVEHLSYDPLDNRYDSSIFTENQTAQDLSKAGEKLKKSVIPAAFWYFSVAGGATLLAYAIHRRDPVFIIGQGAGLLIYFRNLQFLWRDNKQAPQG